MHGRKCTIEGLKLTLCLWAYLGCSLDRSGYGPDPSLTQSELNVHKIISDHRSECKEIFIYNNGITKKQFRLYRWITFSYFLPHSSSQRHSTVRLLSPSRKRTGLEFNIIESSTYKFSCALVWLDLRSID